MPGPYLDAHIHLWEYCLFQYLTSLETASSLEEALELLKSRPFANWYVGVNLNQENLEERAFPDRVILDRWFNNRPCLLVRSCLHLVAMNTSAMQSLQLYTDDGLFLEADVFSILNRLLSIVDLDSRAVVKSGWERLKAFGYTRVIDMAMDKWKRSHFLRPDFYTVDWDLLDEALGFKIFLDGSLGARTAALFESYADDPGNYGRLNYSDQELAGLFKRVHRSGKPVACHAIGDRAVDQFLRVVQISRHPLDRLEHLQVARAEQLDRLACLDIPVCIQPVFSRELSWALKPWAMPG